MTDALRDQLQASFGTTYTIVREIGRGGMATVSLARDVKHDRDDAIKVLDPEIGAVLGGELRDRGATRAGVSFTGKRWPHGFVGKAVPHGTVFSR